MMDQSHNVTDPIESLIVECRWRCSARYAQALLVDRAELWPRTRRPTTR